MEWSLAFHEQAEHCLKLGSPFTARLMRLCATRLDSSNEVGRRLIEWPGEASPRADALPLRFAGALHALARAGRAGLGRVYPPNHGELSDAAFWKAIEQAMQQEPAFLLEWLGSAPQTNEVARCGALFPGLLQIAQLTGLPCMTSELGASAGLNLHWNEFYYELGGQRFGDHDSSVRLRPQWSGAPAPAAELGLHSSAGCDLQPLDARDARDRERLLSYVWADQSERLARTQAALELAARSGLRVQRADAIDWLAARLELPHPGSVHVVCHSIAWQYFARASQERGVELLEQAGARATRAAPLAWLRMEGDGEAPGAALSLRLWPTGEEQLIARADFHGRWIQWRGWQ